MKTVYIVTGKYKTKTVDGNQTAIGKYAFSTREAATADMQRVRDSILRNDQGMALFFQSDPASISLSVLELEVKE